jgi:hypothetical protein
MTLPLSLPPRARLRAAIAAAAFCCVVLTSGAASAQVNWKRVGTVSTLTNGQLCKTDGTNVICDSTTPSISASNFVGIGSTAPVVSVDDSQNPDAIALPGGSNAQRPTGAALVNGEIRYNNTGTGAVEAYYNGAWNALVTSATAGTSTPAAGSTGYVQFNSGGDLAASSNFFWDNTHGRVGIGTTAPTAPLHVFKSGVTAPSVATLSGDGQYSGTPQLLLTGAANANQTLAIGYNTTSDYSFIQSTKQSVANEPLALNPSGGNVGIGTTIPSMLLDVYTPSTSASAAYVKFEGGAASTGNIQITQGGGQTVGEIAEFYTTNVNPRWALGRDLLASGQAGIGFAVKAGNGLSNFIGTDANSNLGFYAGSTSNEFLTIQQTTGNVGIGTTSPSYLLHAYTNSAWGNGDVMVIQNASGTSGARVAAINSSGNGAYVSSFGPSFGNGLSGLAALSGDAGVIIYSDSNSTTGGSHDITFSAGGYQNNTMVVSHTGNIGIGTANPSSALHIYGSNAVLSLTNGNFNVGNFTNPNTAAGQTGANYINNFNNYTGLYMRRSGTGTGDYLAVEDSNLNPIFYVKGTGNVGIGTTSPSQLLSVGNTNQFTVTSGGALTAQSATIESSSVVPVVVSGSGSPSPNGTYGYVGIYNNVPYYQNGSWYIYKDATYNDWRISQTLGSTGGNQWWATGGSTAPLVSGWTVQNYSGSVTTSAGTAESTVIDGSGDITAGGVLTVQGSGNSSFAGNVAVGTASIPTGVTADVNGPVKVAGTGSEPCTAAQVGAIRYNPTGQYFELCSYP